MVTRNIRVSYIFYIAVLSALLLSSCATKRKVLVNPASNKGRPLEKKTVLTDASDARDIVLTGAKYDDYARLLGVATKELNNKSLYNFIDSWMGSPHRLGGSHKSGIDCSRFVGILYESVYGKDLPRTSRDMGDRVKRKYEKGLKEGDLVFFSFGGKNIDHVGVYLQNNKFVHVSTKRGVIISNLRDSWYYKYFVRAGTPTI
ncbi:NlpC/P60 family protein [Sphingobacterium sp. UT-1RO-CII-1]|uniref:C40 family peptidase n=1 Tax=Sphingobacterium sp. UT-1RO-CII-1 TaxID=2995225 RepID=UPI00227A79D4|nr:NlpC/P60 family protein [Sphingobacterium sp. UT-1RO-CII-1]MCY4780093.1 NlpC/P60 family protein [Sphingobacterium sp. UT-1RO-CII-1]